MCIRDSSYCEASLGGGSCANTDNSTASTSLASVVDFFQNKFPTLARNQFYITGESYAGVYVPTLARWIVDHNDQDGSFKINLKGIAAGDPCTDNKFQADSVSVFLLSSFLFHDVWAIRLTGCFVLTLTDGHAVVRAQVRIRPRRRL